MTGFDGILRPWHSSNMLSHDFLSGHYSKTIEQLHKKAVNRSDVISLIGAYSFLGKLFEAQKMFRDHKNHLNDVEKSVARFFIGLTLTRKSEYKKAVIIFNRNYQILKKTTPSPIHSFYVYQGMAFYLYFIGKLKTSKKWGLRAYDAAMSSRDVYARSLALDLLGHLKVRLGEINAGLNDLKAAADLARKLNNISVGEAMEISHLQYKAQFGLESNEILEQLKAKYFQLQSEDNYSRGAIGLELARQLTLRGMFLRAEEILASSSSHIFASENRRQEMTLNIRYAENAFQMGKTSLAWNHIRMARRCLHFEADKAFEVQILGMELKLFPENLRAPVEKRLLQLSQHYDSLINQNILHRLGLKEADTSLEDHFALTLKKISSHRDPIHAIIESQYLSLLYLYLDIPRNERCLYFDQQNNRMIFFLNEEISLTEKTLTKTDIKLFLLLQAGHQTKADLCSQVWGYQYQPERHDTIIHTSLSSLRKKFGRAAVFIETTENGYQLNSKLKLILSQLDSPPIPHFNSGPPLPLKAADLNLRQLKALNYLKNNEALDVTTYRKIFNVTEVTASRDLRGLKKNGFVESVGRARAIKYVRTEIARKS